MKYDAQMCLYRCIHMACDAMDEMNACKHNPSDGLLMGWADALVAIPMYVKELEASNTLAKAA